MEGNRVWEEWFRNILNCMEGREERGKDVGQNRYDKKRKPE